MEHFCNIVHVQIFAENENWKIEIESNSQFSLQTNAQTPTHPPTTSLLIFLGIVGVFPIPASTFHFTCRGEKMFAFVYRVNFNE